jgi:hypothetical protein
VKIRRRRHHLLNKNRLRHLNKIIICKVDEDQELVVLEAAT